MLKIKADKMGELKKFGFGDYSNSLVWNDGTIQISVCKHSKLITIIPFNLDCSANQFVLQKFYDLIKADIIE